MHDNISIRFSIAAAFWSTRSGSSRAEPWSWSTTVGRGRSLRGFPKPWRCCWAPTTTVPVSSRVRSPSSASRTGPCCSVISFARTASGSRRCAWARWARRHVVPFFFSFCLLPIMFCFVWQLYPQDLTLVYGQADVIHSELCEEFWTFFIPSTSTGCRILSYDSLNNQKARTTDTNLGQAHCLGVRAPTLDLGLEITKRRKFVIQGFVWITEF
jgi:hypothetical protein